MARRRPATVHGLVIVDKAAGMTSHDVVAALRRRLGERRIGHAGTLDPDATGVLVIGVGSATRLLRYVGDSTKAYTAEVVVGIETDTLDASGTVTVRHDRSIVDLDEARAFAAAHLTGEILQVPPMVSALHHEGRRLHELAREGIEVERAPRPVTVEHFAIEPTDDPEVLAIEVRCSAGTYIRTLAADLGRGLGTGAHLRNLRRTAVGSFGIDESAPWEDAPLLGVAEAVRSLDAVRIGAESVDAIAHGGVLDAWPGDGPWAVFDPDGVLLAVYEAFGIAQAKPSVVLATTSER